MGNCNFLRKFAFFLKSK